MSTTTTVRPSVHFGAAVSLHTQAETLATLVQRAYNAVAALKEIEDELPLLSEHMGIEGERNEFHHALETVVNELRGVDPDELIGVLFAVEELRAITKQREEVAERDLDG
jgi:hypothetical protein